MYMRTNGRPWQAWSRILKTLGAVGCSITFLWSLGLIGYYSAKRPSEPSPERRWTVPLTWTHVSYGTPEENEQLLRLHCWFFPFFALLAAGAAIEKLTEKNEPWRKKSL